jgi:LysR family nitrogen assimilation transcriptional regulator
MASIGLHLDVAWEVSSIPTIIDLVAQGYGHGVLAASAVRISGQADALVARPLEPQLTSALFLVRSATRRATPLVRAVQSILTQLAATLQRV